MAEIVAPGAGQRRHAHSLCSRALRREIIGLLFVKAIALFLIYWVFFGPSVRPEITAPGLAAHLLAPAAVHLH